MAETFGQRIRRVRKEQKLGLRQTASKTGISATFLSRVETEKEPATPSEETIRKLADVLGDDFDELMQLAGRIPTSVKDYMKADPGMPEFLRRAQESNIPSEKLMELLEKAKKENG
jgi:transcriptional regulator with XRE-family HTH domain